MVIYCDIVGEKYIERTITPFKFYSFLQFLSYDVAIFNGWDSMGREDLGPKDQSLKYGWKFYVLKFSVSFISLNVLMLHLN